MTLDDLIIDNEFRTLIPALSSEEYNMLEQNIIEENNVHDPIIVWKEESIIVDGHNRYAILRANPGIPYSIHEKSFANRDEVIAWICRNQLGRRNISDMERTHLLGTAFEAQKRIDRTYMLRDEKGLFLPQERNSTRDKLAKEYDVSASAIERSSRFVRGLGEIEKEVPGTAERIRHGELEVTKKDVMALTTMDDDEKHQAIQAIISGKRIPVSKPVNESEPYNVEDFRSELHRKAETLDKSLELTCLMMHKEMLETDEGKIALNDVLLEITAIVKKYLAYC